MPITLSGKKARSRVSGHNRSSHFDRGEGLVGLSNLIAGFGADPSDAESTHIIVISGNSSRRPQSAEAKKTLERPFPGFLPCLH